MVRPARGDISVHVFDARSGLDDGGTVGKLVYQHDYGSPGAENVIQSTQVSIKYFFTAHSREDVVSFCNEVVKTMESMVAAAYALNP